MNAYALCIDKGVRKTAKSTATAGFKAACGMTGMVLARVAGFSAAGGQSSRVQVGEFGDGFSCLQIRDPDEKVEE